MAAVDQLLFGYDDGHRLLAGSRTLTPGQLRELLPHVDASIEGPGQRQLVGAWVDSLERYLLALIWPAPERPRPGAVWTHALLIGPDDLRGRPLTGLPGLLHRPAPGRLDGYLEPLPWPAPTAPAVAPRPLAQAIVWAALGPHEPLGVVLWDDPCAGEGQLVALLDALPGPARPALSFRTRAQARRDPYRVVLAGAVASRLSEQQAFVIDARVELVEPPRWSNLLDPSGTAARRREFLRRLGAREAATRAQVLALLAVADLLDDAGRGETAPVAGSSEAERAWNRYSQLPGPAGSDGIRDLPERTSAFDVLAVAVEARLTALTRRDPAAALRLIEEARPFIATAATARRAH